MKYLIFALVILAGCDSNATKVLSYKELKEFPVSCAKRETQMAQLKAIQKIKAFPKEIEKLDEQDQLYNARLKSTIWWYSYTCDRYEEDSTNN
jgi:hypothetical protein